MQFLKTLFWVLIAVLVGGWLTPASRARPHDVRGVESHDVLP